jgi:hypothetical protein
VGQLQTYQTQVQRLLHDLSASFWPLPELTDYINEARNRVAQDTKCLRQVFTSINLPQGQETYNPQIAIQGASNYYTGASVIDVMGISIYVNNTRYKSQYMPYTQFDARLRYWVSYQQWPCVYSRVGANTIYVGPIPNQLYVSDWDCAVSPPALALPSDVETIPAPFLEPVQYWAAYKAKFKEQSLGEAAIFEAQYWKILRTCARAFMTRIVPDPYAS